MISVPEGLNKLASVIIPCRSDGTGKYNHKRQKPLLMLLNTVWHIALMFGNVHSFINLSDISSCFYRFFERIYSLNTHAFAHAHYSRIYFPTSTITCIRIIPIHKLRWVQFIVLGNGILCRGYVCGLHGPTFRDLHEAVVNTRLHATLEPILLTWFNFNPIMDK